MKRLIAAIAGLCLLATSAIANTVPREIVGDHIKAASIAIELDAKTVVEKHSKVAFYQSRDSNYNHNIVSGGGGGASYVYATGGCGASCTITPSGTTATFSGINLGSGSKFVILGLQDGAGNTTAVTVNGTSLTLITSFSGNDIFLFAGTVTLTGSDTIVATGSYAFNEMDVMVYTATGLISTTKEGSNSTAGSNVSTTCTVGDFVFAMAASGANFSTSAQTPSGSHTQGTAGNISDWTSNATGCSGGSFTVTTGGFNGQLIATWH